MSRNEKLLFLNWEISPVTSKHMPSPSWMHFGPFNSPEKNNMTIQLASKESSRVSRWVTSSSSGFSPAIASCYRRRRCSSFSLRSHSLPQASPEYLWQGPSLKQEEVGGKPRLPSSPLFLRVRSRDHLPQRIQIRWIHIPGSHWPQTYSSRISGVVF